MVTLQVSSSKSWTAVPLPLISFQNDDNFQFVSQIEELTDYSVCLPNKKAKHARLKPSNDRDVRKRKLKENKGSGETIKKKKEKNFALEMSTIDDSKDFMDSEVGTSTATKLEDQTTTDRNPPLTPWSAFGLSDEILKAIAEQHFTEPTPIQRQCLLPAIRDRLDILGAAETGSGKTLAFSLPIVQGLLDADAAGGERKGGVRALILTPTRELAIQIKGHITAVLKYTNLRVAVIVGGLSIQKQERLLKRRPQILVATPGRLWAMMQEDSGSLCQLSDVEYLVIDETDRMVEKGHFRELSTILDHLNNEKNRRPRQTFVFSATLAFVHPPPKRLASKTEARQMTPMQKIEMLVSLTRLREQRKVVDLTKNFGTADSLVEARIICDSLEEKDTYLYYFLINYPGRTLIFTNSIDCSRRLRNLLGRLNFSALLLNAQMSQKQRLKNLERFSDSKTTVLLATDVAARGLDIKNVDHVLHYQVPRTAEVYIHRSGRTARACSEGLSVMLVDGQDALNYRKICQTLNRDQDLPIFPVNANLLAFLRNRIKLATKLESLQYRLSRLTACKNWFSRAAADAEIEDEVVGKFADDDEDSDEVLSQKRQVKCVAKSLNGLLRQPLPRDSSFKTKFPTSLARLPEILNPRPLPSALETAKSERSQPKKRTFVHGVRTKKSRRKKQKFRKN